MAAPSVPGMDKIAIAANIDIAPATASDMDAVPDNGKHHTIFTCTILSPVHDVLMLRLSHPNGSSSGECEAERQLWRHRDKAGTQAVVLQACVRTSASSS